MILSYLWECTPLLLALQKLKWEVYKVQASWVIKQDPVSKQSTKLKTNIWLDVVKRDFGASHGKAETGISMNSRPSLSTQQDPGQLQRLNLSQKQEKVEYPSDYLIRY